MQLYALDHTEKVISTQDALRSFDYVCVECGHIVRLRKGNFRQPHFFHANPNQACGLHGKSLEHLQVQLYLHALLPESHLEYRFPTIQRIADVFWEKEKIVFEVQCSPIRAEEVLARNQHYHQLGLTVVWILHDKRYNKWNHSSAEYALRHAPSYFTNMNKKGQGIIYDQFEYVFEGRRYYKSKPLQVLLNQKFKPLELSKHPLRQILVRLKYWPIAFQGDLLHALQEEHEPIQQALNAQKKWDAHFMPLPKNPFKTFLQWFLMFYKQIFRIFLKEYCLKADTQQQ